jgi:hypothetical protein
MAATAQSGGADVKRKAATKQAKNAAARRPASARILVRRDGPTGTRLAVIGGANVDDPLKVGERLLRVLRTPDGKRGSRLLFVEFPAAPTKTFRKVLVERVSEGLLADVREYFDGDDAPTDDELLNAEGWDGPRIVLPSRSGPSFALPFIDEIGWYCGFWLGPRTLVLGILGTWSPLEGTSSVSASHGDPASGSGSWREHYAVLGNGIDVAWSYRGESGIYVSFRRSDGDSPATVAKRLEAAVQTWYLYGAENRLLTAHFLGFSKGTVELLGGIYFGYDIEYFSLQASDDVLIELRKRNPNPKQDEAAEWVESIQQEVESTQPGLWEYYTTELHPCGFLRSLSDIAEGKVVNRVRRLGRSN